MRVLILCGIAVLGCAKRTSVPQAQSADTPVLAAVLPETIRVGSGAVTTLELRGQGFEPGTPSAFATGKNTLHVGRATFEGLTADKEGQVIRFPLPLTYTDTATKGRPSSFTPGTYDVRVTTPRGTSNTKSLVMIP